MYCHGGIAARVQRNMKLEADTTQRWRIVGRWDKKPDFKLEEWDFRDDEYKPIQSPKANMKLKEIKAYLLKLYPEHRIYKRWGTKGREFWGFIPENPLDRRGFIN